jgi:O-antigen ligase
MWTLFGLFLAARYTMRDFLKHLGAALLIIAVLSMLFGLLAPAYGTEHGFNEGAWRGAFTTKNVLAETMVIGCLVFWFLARTSRHGWRKWGVPAVLAFVLTVLARSAGALIILGSLFVIIPTILALRSGGIGAALVVCGMVAAGAAASVGISERQVVLSAIGKNVTLTGRTELWGAVTDHIKTRPLLGYGYTAFWEAGSAASQAVRAAVGWDAPHSHNGFLDLWLDLGLVGLLTFLASFALATRHAWAALRVSPDGGGLWILAFLAVIAINNMTESSIYQNQLVWVIYVTVAVMAMRGEGQGRESRRPRRMSELRQSQIDIAC